MAELIQVSGGVEASKKLAKRMLFLAWKAARCVGLGFLQDRGSGMTEDQVWEAAVGTHDYGGVGGKTDRQDVFADYVFGRMMKFGVAWSDRGVTQRGMVNWTPEYQSYCNIYPTFRDLARTAAKELDLEITELRFTTENCRDTQLLQ